jgi:hypothetical protein
MFLGSACGCRGREDIEATLQPIQPAPKASLSKMPNAAAQRARHEFGSLYSAAHVSRYGGQGEPRYVIP